MTDITKCANSESKGGCIVRHVCYRHMANADEIHQSWSMFEPERGANCSGFIDMRNTQDTNPLRRCER